MLEPKQKGWRLQRHLDSVAQTVASVREPTVTARVALPAWTGWRAFAARLAAMPTRSGSELPTRVVAINTFSIWPVKSGGQTRIFELYSRLAQRAEIVHVSLEPRRRPIT